MSEEAFFSEYNSLCSCVLIDARHGSRQQLKKYLGSAQLFDDVVEAKSLDAGKQHLRINTTDACIIGPSTTSDTALKFIGEMSEGAFSKDCAYLAIVEKDSPAFEEFANGGAHWVLETGYSRRALFDAMVRAVVRANANSPWRGVLISQLDGQSIEDLFPTRSSTAIVTAFDDFFQDPGIKDNPKVRIAAESIRNIVNQLYAASSVPERKEFLDRLLKEWKEDVELYSVAVANDLFQTKLRMLNKGS